MIKSLTERLRLRFVKEYESAPIGFPSALLAHLAPRMDSEFHPSISKEDNSYFSKKSKEALHEEFSYLAYYTRCTSAIIAIRAV